jgi:hypothetical protein
VLSMKHWGQHYVQYLNRTYRRSGTLWEERFRSCLMQAQDYVLACEGLSVDQLYPANGEGKTDRLSASMSNTCFWPRTHRVGGRCIGRCSRRIWTGHWLTRSER